MPNKTPEEIEELARLQNIVRNPDGTWQNEGDFESFYCYYCGQKFSTYEEKDIHQKTNHKEGDYSSQMDAGW